MVMKSKELEELADAIINPITAIKYLSKDEVVLKLCDRMVEYIRSIEVCDKKNPKTKKTNRNKCKNCTP